MATKRRQLNTPPKSRVPATAAEWDRLAKRAMAYIKSQGDPRKVEGIQKLIVTGKVEKNFRRMGIVCDADIQRVFTSQSKSTS